MKVIAAYLLAVLGGNESPSTDDIKHILSAGGADYDEGKVSLLLSQLEGKDLIEVIADGREKLSSVPAGGGGGGSAAAAVVSSGGGAAPAEAAKEAPKEEEPKEESDDDMGFSLFE